MINHRRIGAFIIELIRFADDDDIKTFLENIFNDVDEAYKFAPLGSYYYKTTLINYLFMHIHYFIAGDLQEKDEFCPSAAGYIDIVIRQHTPLYLHLYALCECYYSYGMSVTDNSSILKEILKVTNKNFSKNNKIANFTDKDRTKFLRLLINSYAENKFYYYFYYNRLTKVEIISNKASKNDKPHFSYKFNRYDLQDKDGVTYIVNKQKGTSFKLDKNFKRFPIKVDSDNFVEQFCNIFLVNYMSFQDSKKIHQQIVSVLKRKPRTVYCGCCNPNPKNYSLDNLCETCRELFFQLNNLKNNIDEYDPNLYIHSLKSKDFKQLIKDITFDNNARKLFDEMREKLNLNTKSQSTEQNN